MGSGVLLTEIDRRVRGKLSESGTQFFTPQNVLDWINEAQDVLATAVPFTAEATFRASTVPNATIYLLPTPMLVATGAAVRDSTGRLVRVDYVEPQVLDRWKWGSNAATSTRFRGCYLRHIEGPALQLWPAPSQYLGLYIHGYLRPTTLTLGSTSDRTDIPPHLTQAIVAYALWQAKLKDEEIPQAQAAQQEFQRLLDDFNMDRMTKQADQFNRTRAYRQVGGYRWP